MKYLKNVSTLSYDSQKCTGCGRCVDVCPHAVFGMSGGKAAVLDRDRCMECGACRRNCSAGAITVDTGVGCANAIIRGMLTGGEPVCGCSEGGGACC